MKKTTKLRKVLMITISLLFIASSALAQDNLSIGVSFSIPAVPGINVGLDEVKETDAIAQEEKSLASIAREKNQRNLSFMIQQTTKIETKDGGNERSSKVLETIYSR
ncbi:MAG: hypothetical protein KKC42_01685 [Candidatus Omnitrophica bacterium]|nr:hypothetical protein [Candidatus Omnitrophota bacterium]MBU1090542.1 hypothetical protein [Candidatus Omnitrophota bacterium]MBU1906158.1 hypothetical protein [Candidatus Omnitrophota bacterium]